MAKIVNVGENFYKEGKEVTVVNVGKMVINDKECDAVVYDYVNKQYGNIVIEKKSDFIKSTIPTTLRNGDRIVATCMGKITATYKVYGHGHETADAINEIGGKMQFFVDITPNGFVEPLVNESNIPQRTEYLFVSSGIEKKLVVSKFINSCLSKIGNIQKAISSDKLDYDKIDIAHLQKLTLSIDKMKREINKTIKFLNNE